MNAAEKKDARREVVEELTIGTSPYQFLDRRTRYYKNYVKFKIGLSDKSWEQMQRINEVRANRCSQKTDESLQENSIVKFYLENKHRIKSIQDDKIIIFESYMDKHANTERDKKILSVLKKYAPRLRKDYELREEMKCCKDEKRIREIRHQLNSNQN